MTPGPIRHVGCLCGAVRYALTGPPLRAGICHCLDCRKASGTAFNTAAEVSFADFHLLQGADALAEYASSPGIHRVFCGRCGSPLYSRRDATPETIRLRLGTLDTPVDGKPVMQIFTVGKAEWHVLDPAIPAYAERP